VSAAPGLDVAQNDEDPRTNAGQLRPWSPTPQPNRIGTSCTDETAGTVEAASTVTAYCHSVVMASVTSRANQLSNDHRYC
jgi:hypothetical protein